MLWDPFAEDFAVGLAALTTYHAEHDYARVPRGYRTPSGYRLGQWVGEQRVAYNASPRRLSPERIADLETLGMSWDPLEEAFAVGLAALTAYRAEHGHARVPRGYRTPSGYRLGGWVNKQRKAYNTSPRRLSPERTADLEALGMIWDPFAEAFAVGLAELTTYHAEHGDVRVPASYRTPSDYPLGQWVGKQRVAYNASPRRLSPERIADLETLGMSWDPLEEAFAVGLAALTAYHAEHGDVRVPASYRTPSGYQLGTWVSNRRNEYNASPQRISPERIADLEALGMIWDDLAERFAVGLAALTAYHAEHGHVRVPASYRTPSGYRLGQWFRKQRTAYNASPRRISPERIADLEALGMVWKTKR